MHMADALVSTVVGGTMWAVSSGTISYSVKKLQKDIGENIEIDNKVPLMGVMGAFVFASQMINFTIPGTGSSGHISGGILLAVLLGPYGGFLTMACILAIQALFFADGGLLALGCNIFNLGFYTCFVAYPLIYKKITKNISKKTILLGSILSVVVGLQLGSLSVVLETVLSGKTELPFNQFLIFMQPIHLAIGIVEGLITATVLTFIWNARPEILNQNVFENNYSDKKSYKKLIFVLICVTVIIGSVISLYASSNPDGLEWSVEKVTGSPEVEGSSNVHEILGRIQEKVAILPDYDFKQSEIGSSVEGGTSVSGIAGSLITAAAAVLIGAALKLYKNHLISINRN
jgi:cobalt/nickel transport system permease protein